QEGCPPRADAGAPQLVEGEPGRHAVDPEALLPGHDLAGAEAVEAEEGLLGRLLRRPALTQHPLQVAAQPRKEGVEVEGEGFVAPAHRVDPNTRTREAEKSCKGRAGLR